MGVNGSLTISRPLRRSLVAVRPQAVRCALAGDAGPMFVGLAMPNADPRLGVRDNCDRLEMMLQHRLLAVIVTVAGLVAGSCFAEAAGTSGIAWVRAGGRSPVGIAYQEWGLERGSGQALVLIHGMGASRYFWRKMIPALAGEHRVIALDLKGYGRSSKPMDGRYSILDQARLVRAALAERGVTSATVIGHSLGGAVALALAIEEIGKPQRMVERLVLMAAPAFPQSLPPPIEIIRQRRIGETLLEITPAELIARITLYGASLDTSHITEADVAAYAEPLASAGGRAALIATARALEPSRYGSLFARYRRLEVPALLVWCRADAIVPLQTGQRLARTLPDARLEIIEGCNHMPPEEKPAETLVRLKAFLGGR